MVYLLHTSLNDKRDDFIFRNINCPYMNCNMPSSYAYGIFISQLIRYAAPLMRSHDFPISLQDKDLLKIIGEVLCSICESYSNKRKSPLPNVKFQSGACPYTGTPQGSDMTLTHGFVYILIEVSIYIFYRSRVYTVTKLYFLQNFESFQYPKCAYGPYCELNPTFAVNILAEVSFYISTGMTCQHRRLFLQTSGPVKF